MFKKPFKILLSSLALSSFLAVPVVTQAAEGDIYIVPALQWMNWHNESRLNNEKGPGLGIGYNFTDRTSVELSTMWLSPDITGTGSDTDYDHIRLDVLYGQDVDVGQIGAFVVTGLAEAEADDDSETLWDLGVGLTYRITENLEWRTALRNYYSFDRERSDVGIDTGLVIRFGGPRRSSGSGPVASTPAPAPAPAPAAPVIADADRDGVPDNQDACPDTPQNYAVDDEGCPIPIEEVARIELEVTFEFDRSEVRPQFFAEIEQVADFMEQYPDVVAQLEGHTDSMGTDEYNQGLSQRRADAVRQVLIDRFNVQASRVTATGYGESQPVASNDTAAGRAQNRRVITVILQTLQNYQPR